jgi:2-polyprenyl-6-methoxyphenol hydroxylase-like FAD-dependent oxidoreductase
MTLDVVVAGGGPVGLMLDYRGLLARFSADALLGFAVADGNARYPQRMLAIG